MAKESVQKGYLYVSQLNSHWITLIAMVTGSKVVVHLDNKGSKCTFSMTMMIIFLTRCSWHGEKCNASYFTTKTFDMGQCFSFNLDERRHLFTTKTGSQFGLRLVLNIEQYEYVRGPSTDAGVKVSLQDSTSVCRGRSQYPGSWSRCKG